MGGGGIGKIFAGWGGPPSPPQEKNPVGILAFHPVFHDFAVSIG